MADAVNDILKGVQEPATGSAPTAGLALNQQSAGKTGTINDNTAVWFIGYTPNLATAAMIAGANTPGHWITLNGQTVGGTYIAGAHGSTTAGPMWGDAMKGIESVLPDDRLPAAEPADHPGTQTSRSRRCTGMSTDTAAAALRKAGFTPVVGPTVDSANPAGTVAYLSPSSGSQAPTGSTVTIYVSDGTPYVAPQPQPQPQPKAKPSPTKKPTAAASPAATRSPKPGGDRRPRSPAAAERPKKRRELQPRLSRAGGGPPRPPRRRRRGP